MQPQLPIISPGISIHALREEGDVVFDCRLIDLFLFLSTPSARRATASRCCCGDVGPYFYPRPPRGGRPSPFVLCSLCRRRFLSTPSARRATRLTPRPPRCALYFYPRPPRGGRRKGLRPLTLQSGLFLSTPSARRATCAAAAAHHQPGHFYPRPPRGGRQCKKVVLS